MKDLDTLKAEVEQHDLNIALMESEREEPEAIQFEIGMREDVINDILDGFYIENHFMD